jgi:cell division protein FtsW (lipid II flippase)
MVNRRMSTGLGETHRRRGLLVWVIAAVATAAAVVLYGVQIAAAISVRDELQRSCDSHPPLAIAQYFWVTMLLSAIGVVTALASATFASRRLIRFVAVALLLVCGVLFLLACYGFSVRNDTIGPLCTNL